MPAREGVEEAGERPLHVVSGRAACVGAPLVPGLVVSGGWFGKRPFGPAAGRLSLVAPPGNVTWLAEQLGRGFGSGKTFWELPSGASPGRAVRLS